VIHNNVSDLYTKKKTGSAAGKYVLNSDLFPSKESLTDTMFFQVHRNWTKLLSNLAEPEVTRGWHNHHERMISDANFTASFEAWKSHNKQLHVSFFNAPYILDVKSSAYSKGFDKAWINSEISSFQKKSSAKQWSFHANSNQSHLQIHAQTSSNSSTCFSPYDKSATEMIRD